MHLEVYFQVILTRLTPVNKTQLFLKPPELDKNRLVAFHSFTQRKCHYKENAWETNESVYEYLSVWMTLIHFCCYQLTVVKNQLLLPADRNVRTFLSSVINTYHWCVNQCQHHNSFFDHTINDREREFYQVETRMPWMLCSRMFLAICSNFPCGRVRFVPRRAPPMGAHPLTDSQDMLSMSPLTRPSMPLWMPRG